MKLQRWSGTRFVKVSSSPDMSDSVLSQVFLPWNSRIHLIVHFGKKSVGYGAGGIISTAVLERANVGLWKANSMSVLLNFSWIAAVFLLDTVMPMGIEIAILYAVPIAGLVLWSTEKDSSLVFCAATICSAFTIVVFLLAPGKHFWIGMVNRTMSILVIWITAMLSVWPKRMESGTNVLRELLPICSYCKRIRDTNGYWNNIEVYIAARLNINFTHSVCPKCGERHFPHVATM